MDVRCKLTLRAVQFATKPVVTVGGYCVEGAGAQAFPQMSEANSCTPALRLGGRTRLPFVKKAFVGLSSHIWVGLLLIWITFSDKALPDYRFADAALSGAKYVGRHSAYLR